MIRAAARVAAVAVALTACGPKSSPPEDLCLTAIKRGPPPAEVTCDEGAEPRSALEPPSRLARIPGPSRGRPGDAVVERRWCATAGGDMRGPYVGLDRSGQVVESGSFDREGRRSGAWIIWSGAVPRAVGHYDAGASRGLEACDLEQLTR